MSKVRNLVSLPVILYCTIASQLTYAQGCDTTHFRTPLIADCISGTTSQIDLQKIISQAWKSHFTLNAEFPGDRGHIDFDPNDDIFGLNPETGDLLSGSGATDPSSIYEIEWDTTGASTVLQNANNAVVVLNENLPDGAQSWAAFLVLDPFSVRSGTFSTDSPGSYGDLFSGISIYSDSKITAVPEIDGGSAGIAIGLLLGIFGIFRESRRAAQQSLNVPK